MRIAPRSWLRHKDSRYDVHDLLRRGWFEAYQAGQSKPKFDGCEFIVSFVGLEGTKAGLSACTKSEGSAPGSRVRCAGGVARAR